MKLDTAISELREKGSTIIPLSSGTTGLVIGSIGKGKAGKNPSLLGKLWNLIVSTASPKYRATMKLVRSIGIARIHAEPVLDKERNTFSLKISVTSPLGLDWDQVKMDVDTSSSKVRTSATSKN